VSRGGHGTLSQSICYGKPVILVPTPSHTEQLNNAKKAVDLGVAELILQENLNREVLLKAVKKLLDAKHQERSKQLQNEVLQYNGLDTAAKIIQEKAK
jgi:UDP-N-acetylglucosamine--N-acetylmuramyl-(pentapeptide) pyrophosphoryl-undecaprenol N-acetylglucosamine transferase